MKTFTRFTLLVQFCDRDRHNPAINLSSPTSQREGQLLETIVQILLLNIQMRWQSPAIEVQIRFHLSDHRSCVGCHSRDSRCKRPIAASLNEQTRNSINVNQPLQLRDSSTIHISDHQSSKAITMETLKTKPQQFESSNLHLFQADTYPHTLKSREVPPSQLRRGIKRQ